MRKALLFSWLLFVLLPATAWSQAKVVTGTVKAMDDNTGLPGVNIRIAGTSTGTVTDMDGKYRLEVPSAEAVLQFTYIGYLDEQEKVGNRSVIDVSMSPNLEQLSEVVVVGYGTQLKEQLTGNIAKISGDAIANVTTPTLETALQGRAAGVYINQGSGKLGAGLNIRVRGSASVSAGNQPLYVVDGIPITSADLGAANTEPLNPIADLNPNDIQSIEILKDASAAAIYGSRASNGVVLITTKSGRAGKTQVNLNYFTGFSRPTKVREFLNREEYIELFSEAATNEGYDPAEEFEFELGATLDSPYNQKWWEEPFQRGHMSQYELSLNGGNEKTRFYISANYNTQEGIIIGNEFDRATGRLNLDHDVNKKLTVGTNLSVIRSLNRRVSDDNAFSNPIQLNALPPLQPKIDPATGRLNKNTLYYNNLINQRDGINDATTYRSIGNVFADYKIMENLRFRTEHGYDFLNLQEEIYLGKETEDGGPTGYGYQNQFTVGTYNTNNTLTYANTFSTIHKVEVLGGFSYQTSSSSGGSVEARAFPNDQFKKIASAARITDGSSSATDFRFVSYFGRANYILKDRYLFSASARIDGSSRFGADNRYGTFPAVSGGWIITEEPFLQNNKLLSFLKLRASWGLTGNAEISNFAPLALYEGVAYEDVAGISVISLPNPDLRWERTAQTDVGIDFGFFKDRITGELDYYVKNTTDLLLNLPIPAYQGFTTITKNLGKLENKGVEFVLNTRNIVGDFSWSSSFNIARNVNKILDMDSLVVFGESERFVGQVREGYPIGVFWGPKYAGVDPANGDALYFIGPGNSEVTNDYSQAQDQMIGDPNPEFIGGLNNTFTYKGLSLDILMQFVYGNDIYNVAGIFQSVNGDYFDNQTKDQLERWQEPGDITDVPQARLYAGNGTDKSSRWVQDGSFLRMKNVRLGYRLPDTIIKRISLASAQVYIQGTNLLTFTNYDGYDPEVNTSFNGRSNVTLGHDFYTPPLARTITFGVTIGL